MADHQNLYETFRMTPVKRHLFNAPELPSEETTVKILLKKSVSCVLKPVNKWLTDGMSAKAYPDGNNKNAIVVKGIPPDHNYDAYCQEVLKAVKKTDPEARLLR